MLILTSDHDISRLERKIDFLVKLVRLSLKLENREMGLLEDIDDAENKITAKLTDIGNFQVATKAALDAKDAKIAELTTDLLAAQNSGATPAQLQAILDKANAMLNAADNDAQTEAIFANTSAGPASTPSDTPPPPAELPPADVPPVDTTPVDTPPAT